MNRRAKRHKYRRMEQKYKNQIRMYLTRDAFIHASETRREIRTLSVLFNDDYSKARAQNMPDVQKAIAANRMADEIMKNKDFIKVIDAGYGVIYQLDIIMPKEL